MHLELFRILPMDSKYRNIVITSETMNPDAINKLLQDTIDGKINPAFSTVKGKMVCTNLKDLTKALPKAPEPVQQGPVIG